ncbi:MAG: hypothetical protein OXE73_08325 [Gammaproteobacteria bacterium]|nr:hypothetical protein [Gammaproteobacteria bacterium]
MNRQTVPPFLAVVLAAGTFLPAALHAQEGSGFLFSRPGATFNFRTGYDIPRANSDVFSYTSELLTLEKSSFAAPVISVDIGVRLTERLELVGGVGYAKSVIPSEFRDWEDNRGQPIEQVTTHSKLPFTVSARYYLRDRGRSLSRFAWVPSQLVPYVGAGAGGNVYKFEQDGDFVDIETLDVFEDLLVSGGTAPFVHVFSGIEYALGARFVLTAEGRYSWSSSPMDRSFEGFENIDLSGFQILAGVGIRMSG